MKTIRIRCMGLKLGAPVSVYETIDEAATAVPGGQDGVLAYFNKYFAEKVALVDCRDIASETLEKDYNFPMITKEVTKTNEDGTTVTNTEPDESEKEHFNRFRAALTFGKLTLPGVEANEKAVEDFLQGIVDAKGPYIADATKPERVTKAKAPPAKALEAATRIIANGNQAKWQKTFDKEGIEYKPFDTADTAANAVNLAWALKAREDAKYVAYA